MADWYQYKSAAQVAFESGRITASWLHLLHAEFQRDEQTGRWLTRKPNTPRQKEVQRLWQQRGLLERTKANLNSTRKLVDEQEFPIEAWKLEEASRIINALISRNMDDAATVKERIPK